jgi:hypothetical protein
MMGRSFGVGWGPNNIFIHPGKLQTNLCVLYNLDKRDSQRVPRQSHLKQASFLTKNTYSGFTVMGLEWFGAQQWELLCRGKSAVRKTAQDMYSQ